MNQKEEKKENERKKSRNETNERGSKDGRVRVWKQQVCEEEGGGCLAIRPRLRQMSASRKCVPWTMDLISVYTRDAKAVHFCTVSTAPA